MHCSHKKLTLTFTSLTLLALSACGSSSTAPSSGPSAEEKRAVVNHYADIALAVFESARDDAQDLNDALASFLTNPTTASLEAAKSAYVVARSSYQQSEVLRFDEAFVSNAPDSDGGLASVDSWEGQLNAWPLDEALIDYVDGDYSGASPDGGGNIVASTSLVVNGETVDTSSIDKNLLISLNEIGGSEANVATGYHAIEFLLWGQDLSQDSGVTGQRPVSDYVLGGGCSNGNCDRRATYLQTLGELLVEDLETMVVEWTAASVTKTLRSDLLAQSSDQALQRILFGMGSLALGELASERMRVARTANSPEDEHDCFSDSSHNSYFYNGEGVANVYLGTFQRADGSTLSGPSLSSLLASVSVAADDEIRAALSNVRSRLMTLKASGDTGDTFDYLIDGNDSNELILAAEEALLGFTEQLEAGAAALNIEINSDGGSQFD